MSSENNEPINGKIIENDCKENEHKNENDNLIKLPIAPVFKDELLKCNNVTPNISSTVNTSSSSSSNMNVQCSVNRFRIRRSLSMMTDVESKDLECSPFLSSIQFNLNKPSISFTAKRALLQNSITNENDSPSVIFHRPQTVSLKRSEAFTPISSSNKRSRGLTPINLNNSNIAANTSNSSNNSTSKNESDKCDIKMDIEIMKAIEKSSENPNYIGDGTKTHLLPWTHGRHQELKMITPETLASVINGKYSGFVYTIIDCRYPYEFEGGHIIGAKNIYTREDIYSSFLNNIKSPDTDSSKRNILIFHCEFSSERAPSLCRFLRSEDRKRNIYPKLSHPELYILQGGYKAFFEKFKELCEPQQYLPMLAKEHKHQIRHFKCKSKSWNCSNLDIKKFSSKFLRDSENL